MEGLSEQVRDLKSQLSAAKTAHKQEVDSLKTQIGFLESRVRDIQSEQDDLEQYSRRNSLRIWSNQPESQSEDTDQIVIDQINTLQVSFGQINFNI